MTKYHSDDYIKFLRSIRPDNMSEFTKQMQRCKIHLSQADSSPCFLPAVSYSTLETVFGFLPVISSHSV